jgi:hypothetical protein
MTASKVLECRCMIPFRNALLPRTF